jgi:hypothetical protein
MGGESKEGRMVSNPSEAPKPRRNFFWPKLDTRDDAQWAVKQALFAAVFCTIVTATAATLAACGVSFVSKLGITAWSFVDAAMFGGVAFGLHRHSRFAAWAGLILYVAERAYSMTRLGPSNPFVAIIFTLAFIGGLRATYALQRIRRAESEPAAEAVTARPTPIS